MNGVTSLSQSQPNGRLDARTATMTRGCRRDVTEKARPHPLPLSLQPQTGETFASFASRLAYHRYSCSLASLLEQAGLDPAAPIPVLTMTRIEMTNAAAAFGLDHQQLSDLLLTRYPVVRGSVIPPATASERAAAEVRTANQRALLVARSRACPLCLSDGAAVRTGRWKSNWKLALSATCPDHHLLLIDHCPECGSELGRSHRHARRGLVDPVRCNEPRHPGRPGLLCSFDLRDGHLERVGDDSRLNRAQRVYLDAIGDEGQTALVTEVHALMALLLRYGSPDRVGDLEAAAEVAFDRHCAERHDRLKRGRPLTVPYPATAALAASVLPAAVETTTAPDDELRERLDELLAGRTGRFSPRTLGSTRRLRTALTQLRARRARAKLHHDWLIATEFPSELRPEHVPQLFWQPEYDAHLYHYYVGPRPDTFRRYCSLALALAVGADSFADACARLGVPNSRSSRSQFRAAIRFERGGSFGSDLASAAREWVDWIDEPVNYAARRAALADLVNLPAGFDFTDSQRNLAAAWLWTELTSGDARLSPAAAARTHYPEMKQYVYELRRFTRSRRFQEAASAVMACGVDLLSLRGLGWDTREQ